MGATRTRRFRISRFEILPRAAHFPHLENPEGLAAVLLDFLETTEPGRIDDGDWGRLIAPHSPAQPGARARGVGLPLTQQARWG